MMRRILPFIAALMAAGIFDYAAEPVRSFAAIAHQSNPTHDLRFRDLLALFQGTSRQWPDNRGVVLVERDTGSSPFRYLIEHLLNTTPSEYKRSLQNIEYRGEAPVSIKILNSDVAACQYVFNVPSALAIIETESLTSPACAAIMVLRIDGKLPGEEGYRLK
jgi:hypothetical protein